MGHHWGVSPADDDVSQTATVTTTPIPHAPPAATLVPDESADLPEDRMNRVMHFLNFATDTQRLADQAKWISYGPARKSSAPLVGLYHDGKTEMAPNMPTNPDNMKKALGSSYDFWVDHEAELTERFNAWLSAS